MAFCHSFQQGQQVGSTIRTRINIENVSGFKQPLISNYINQNIQLIQLLFIQFNGYQIIKQKGECKRLNCLLSCLHLQCISKVPLQRDYEPVGDVQRLL
jgi:hypothetical protein